MTRLPVLKPASSCTPQKLLRPKSLLEFAKVFKALGDETRLEIVALLAASTGELCVCDLEAHFDLSQPTISHHLKLLREANLVTSERRGTWVYYALSKEALERLDAFRAALAG